MNQPWLRSLLLAGAVVASIGPQRLQYGSVHD